MKGGGSSSFHYGKSSSNWAPECLNVSKYLLYVLSFPLPLHRLNDQNRNTAESEQRTQGRGVGAGVGVEKGDTFLLSYEFSNSTSGMMLQSLGKPSA